jgi:polysaccharide biosynthesis transport protein
VTQPEAPLVTLGQQWAIDEGIGLDQCWRVLRRHWGMMAVAVSLTIACTTAAVSLMTPEYTANSTLLIEPEPPRVLDVTNLLTSENSDDHDYYKTQFELLKSRELAGRVISELKLARNPIFNSVSLQASVINLVMSPFAMFSGSEAQETPAGGAGGYDWVRSDAIDHYLTGLKVEPIPGTRLVTISYSAADRSLAARIVNRHVRDYVQMGIDLRAQAGKSARDFLAGQLIEIGSRVQKSEAALNSYRHRMGIMSFGLDEKNNVAAERMADLNKALTDVETKRLNAQAQMMLVQAGDYESLPQVIDNPAITALELELRRLQAEYARLSTAFNPGYPKLDETRAQLNTAKRALSVRIRDVAKAVQRTYIAAETEEKRLSGEINTEKARDLAINDASLRDAVLVREVETNRQLYKNVLQRMQEMEVTEQAPLSNISIVDDAVLSRSPSKPKKTRDICAVGLLALLMAVGWAFFEDQRDDRLRTLEEVEGFLGLPSLGLVPDFARLGSRSSRRKRLSSGSSPTAQLIGTRAHSIPNIEYYPIHYIPGTIETYRMIRTALLFSRAGSPPRTIAVSSAVKGEGKTFTAANTALVFAQTGARTLLVDADLRRPACHSLMHEANQMGLSDVLAGQTQLDDAIRPTTVENLFLLTAGSTVPNPAELLISNKMHETLDTLRERFDMVLVDSAPLVLASDSCAMATMVDGVVLVIGADTPKTNVRRAHQRLQHVGAKILGVLLNRVNINAPGHDEFLGYYRSYEAYEKEASH